MSCSAPRIGAKPSLQNFDQRYGPTRRAFAKSKGFSSTPLAAWRITLISLAKAVATIKSNSSRWANEEGLKLAWQQGYAAFSVSASIVPAVVRYIQNQEAHHRKISFDEEFLILLRKHGVEFDPKFVLG